MMLQTGQWLSVSLSVLLTVILFGSLGSHWAWTMVYGAIGLVLSITQFSLPLRMRHSFRNRKAGALLAMGTLFLLLQLVSLSASVGSLSSSLGQAMTNNQQLQADRELIHQQIRLEQDRIAVWNEYDQPTKADASIATIQELRAELKALPAQEHAQALSLVATLSSLSGISQKSMASWIYIVLSVLLDACAVYFLLGASQSQPEPEDIRVQPHPVRDTLSEQLVLDHTIDIPYRAIIDGVCKLSVRSIMEHYGVGSAKAYAIINELTDQGFIKKDNQSNRYLLTERADIVRS